jgi:hypothetical protein
VLETTTLHSIITLVAGSSIENGIGLITMACTTTTTTTSSNEVHIEGRETTQHVDRMCMQGHRSMHTTDSVVSTRQVDRPTHPGQRRGNMVRFAVAAVVDTFRSGSSSAVIPGSAPGSGDMLGPERILDRCFLFLQEEEGPIWHDAPRACQRGHTHTPDDTLSPGGV